VRTLVTLRSRAAVVICALMVAVAGTIPASPAHSYSIMPVCAPKMDTPHNSSGAGGVIAKLRHCLDGYDDLIEVTLLLYLCPNPPSGNEQNWENEGCVPKAAKTYTWYQTSGTWYTRYVPPTGQSGAHGTGYWVACAAYVTPSIGMFASPSAYISA
jgi:hypothetical protein